MITPGCRSLLPAGVHFVPAHPVAGTEHSGPDAGFAELFENRWCILTPPEGTDAQVDAAEGVMPSKSSIFGGWVMRGILTADAPWQ